MKTNKKELIALLTATTVALSMSGCGKKDSVLEDSILDHTEVVLADGNVIIAQNLAHDFIDSFFHADNVNAVTATYHEHYKNIVNGIKFTDANCTNPNDYIIYSDIQKLGDIEDYLTEEELKKSLTKDGLSDEEIISIIERIKNEVIENEKEKVLNR